MADQVGRLRPRGSEFDGPIADLATWIDEGRDWEMSFAFEGRTAWFAINSNVFSEPAFQAIGDGITMEQLWECIKVTGGV